MSEMSSGDASASGYGVSNQLASLVPTFDPAKDDMTMYQQRVELVLAAWPKNRIQELVTRLILNCQGSAFQKLQLHHQELSSGDEKAVQKLIELLGGSWGRIALQKQYEEAEQALFHCSQRSDETNDSFLARADILWSRLLSRKLSWEDLQAFVLLRGSTLSPEEKKKVILDADSSASGKLTVARVSDAIRLLEASFFGDLTRQKRSTRLKVYDNNAVLVAEDDEPADHPAFAAEETGEDEMFEQLLQEGDPDAALIADYEATAQDVLQEDSDLASAFSAYQEARNRLAEKQRHRGFWPPSRPMGNSATSSWSKGKGRSFQQSFGKGKGSFTRPKRSLQDRIMSSTCRNCGRKGHWKAECPHKSDNQTSSAASVTTTAAATTSVALSADDGLALEFVQLPECLAPTLDQETDSVPEAASFVGVGVNHQGSNKVRAILGKSRDNLKALMHATMTARQRLQQWGHRSEHHASVQVIRDQLRRRRGRCHPAVVQPSQCPDVNQQIKVVRTHNHESSDTTALSYFATHGSFGILDLGASKTVIGTTQLASLINGLEPQVRARLQRCPCNITFRFGNEGTLTSKQALVVPVGNKLLKIAIVEGGTPFLLSNALMRALEATIDCQARKLVSPVLSKPIDLHLTSKGLFLLDLNDLVQQSSMVDVPTPVTETFMSEEMKENVSPCNVGHLQATERQSVHAKSFVKPATSCTPCHDHPPEDVPQKSSASSISHQSCSTQPYQFADESKPPKQVQFDFHHSHPSNSQEPCLPSFTSDGRPRFAQHVRPDSQVESSSGSAGTRSAVQFGPPDSAGVGKRGDLVRGGSHGPHVFPSVVRPGVGEIHDDPIPQELKGVSHEIPQIRGVEDRSGRSRNATASNDAQSPGICHPQGKVPPKGHAGLHHGASWRCHRHLFAGWGRKRGIRDRDVRHHDYECPAGTTGDHACPSDSHAQHGGCPAEGDSPPRDHPAEERLSDEEAGDLIATSVHEETVFLHKLITQITQEFEEVKQSTRAIGPRWTLGEIFSSEKSPLTHQVNQMNAQAFRFGYQQGDLETSQGRKQLLSMVCRHRPKHLWYSPTCGPWSSWTQLNASRSLFHEKLYQQKRHDLLYQVALGIVLFRHQVSHGDHFHWEQPGRSLMFQLSQMSEVHRYTMACELDLCAAGELRDPQNQKLIKKSLVILTTSRGMYFRFHGLKCQHDHEHQSLEGSTCTSQGRMLRTQFSEVYPRKFARAVAHVLLKHQREWPVNWQPGMLALHEAEPCLVLGSARKAGPPKFVRSEVTFPEPRASPEAKRRKLTGKQSELPSLESFQQIIQTISIRAPRVGKVEITDSEIVNDLQNLFPQKLIQRVIACRGTDRTLGPRQNMMSQEAPYRRSLMVIRSNGKVAVEKHWERWDQLSKRQLIRPAHACRLNITMFGSDHPSSPDASSSSVETGVSPTPVEPMPENMPCAAEQIPPQSAVPDAMPGSPEDTVPKMSPIPEINRGQQGLRFKMLPKWEQQWLLRVHKNLGHPSNDRLVKALQMQGAHPGLIQAAQELACQICKSQEPPKNARPARLKPMLDFNHRIYLDGIDWTNS